MARSGYIDSNIQPPALTHHGLGEYPALVGSDLILLHGFLSVSGCGDISVTASQDLFHLSALSQNFSLILNSLRVHANFSLSDTEILTIFPPLLPHNDDNDDTIPSVSPLRTDFIMYFFVNISQI